MISEQLALAYCSGDISKIENYEQAKNDKTQTWHIHHRAEILPCGRFSRDNLIKYRLYYQRPANELIFLTRAEHTRLHRYGTKFSTQQREYISIKTKEGMKSVPREKLQGMLGRDGCLNPFFGRHHTEETKKKISEAGLGRKQSESTKIKRANSNRGKKRSEEFKQHMREVMKGKNKGHIPWNKGKKTDAATRKKISESTKVAMQRPDVRERYLTGYKNRKDRQ